jgi:hypothetical protein
VQAPETQRPFVVTIIPEDPAPQTTVGDVVVGSLGVAGTLLVLAMLLGVVLAAVRLGWNRLHPPADDHLPSVTPGTTFSPAPTVPPSSQAQ